MDMQENRNDDVMEIDFLEIFMLLLSRWWLIALSAVLIGAGGFLISHFLIPEEYESTTEIYILNNVENVTYSDIQMGTQLTKDYAHLITTRDVLEQVIEILELDEGYGSLVSNISVQTPSDTRIVAITVTDLDPARAQTIANTVREVASEHITNVMAIDAVNVASVANYPTGSSAPSVPKWTLIGFLIGGVLSSGIIIVGYLLDDTVKTSDDVERFLNLSTLGMIPTNNEEEARKDSRRKRYSREFTQSGTGSGNTNDAGDTLEEIDLDKQPSGKPSNKSSNKPSVGEGAV